MWIASYETELWQSQQCASPLPKAADARDGGGLVCTPVVPTVANVTGWLAKGVPVLVSCAEQLVPERDNRGRVTAVARGVAHHAEHTETTTQGSPASVSRAGLMTSEGCNNSRFGLPPPSAPPDC